MKLLKTTLITTLACALATISPQVLAKKSKGADEVTKITYSCKGGKNLEVVFINTGNSSYAVINQMDEMIPMELMKMASGTNYQAISKNYTYKLYTKGKTADLVEGDDKPVLSECVAG